MFKKNDKSLLEEAIATLHDEMANYTDFFTHNGDPITVFVMMIAKDGGSLLRKVSGLVRP